jgi:hypothetical protein
MRDEGREIGTSVRDHVRDTLDRLVKRGVSGHVFGHMWTRVLRGVNDQAGARVYNQVEDECLRSILYGKVDF